MTRFSRFAVAGGIGFVADAAALALLLQWLDPVIARVFSIAFALTITWLINRHFTFAPSSRGIVRESARYGGVGIGSSLVNFSVYAAIIWVAPQFPPLVALVAASATALLFSWFGYSRMVFDR